MHLVIALLQPTPPPTAADGRSPELVPTVPVPGAGIELPQIGIDLRDFGIGFRER